MTYHLAREGNELPRKKRIVPTTQELITSFEKEVVQRSAPPKRSEMKRKAVEWNKDQGPFYIDVITWEALDPSSAGEEPPSLVEIPEDICAIYAETINDEIIAAFLREKYEGWEAEKFQWEDDSWPEEVVKHTGGMQTRKKRKGVYVVSLATGMAGEFADSLWTQCESRAEGLDGWRDDSLTEFGSDSAAFVFEDDRSAARFEGWAEGLGDIDNYTTSFVEED